MSDRGSDATANSFYFETTDLAQDRQRFFSQLRLYAKNSHWSSPIANEIELIVEEWWTNLISYALIERCDPIVTVRIEVNSRSAWIEIRDNGVPFDPSSHPDPDLSVPVEERPIGGLGIYMMKKLSRSFVSKRVGGQNILLIEKDLTQPVLGNSKESSRLEPQ